MKYLKKYENLHEISFTPNDLILYFKENTELWEYPWINNKISDFLNKVLLNNNVSFSCDNCFFDDANNYYATTRVYKNKNHKGLVRGLGYGYDEKRIYLTLNLNRIKYRHEVNTNKPITIYGKIDSESKKIIEETNKLSSITKYNL